MDDRADGNYTVMFDRHKLVIIGSVAPFTETR